MQESSCRMLKFAQACRLTTNMLLLQASLVAQFLCTIPLVSVETVLAWLKPTVPFAEQAQLCRQVRFYELLPMCANVQNIPHRQLGSHCPAGRLLTMSC